MIRRNLKLASWWPMYGYRLRMALSSPAADLCEGSGSGERRSGDTGEGQGRKGAYVHEHSLDRGKYSKTGDRTPGIGKGTAIAGRSSGWGGSGSIGEWLTGGSSRSSGCSVRVVEDSASVGTGKSSRRQCVCDCSTAFVIALLPAPTVPRPPPISLSSSPAGGRTQMVLECGIPRRWNRGLEHT